MQGLNKTFTMGNLTEDPELRYTNGGGAVMNMRVAVNERYKTRDGEWKESVSYHTCVLWGKRAEALSRFLRKGQGIHVEGSLRNSSYEGKDGQKRYKTEINARNVILTGKGGGGESGGGQSGYGGGSSGGSYGGGSTAPAAVPGFAKDDDAPPSSIPF